MKCPFCKEDSFAKKKNIMDGWTLVKTVEVCALCGRELPESGASEAKTDSKNCDRRAGLAALLGEALPEKITLSGSGDRDFCRNCVHFIEHPFQVLCGKNGEAADPMGSCPDFKDKCGNC